MELEWTGADEFRIDDISYVCRPIRIKDRSTPDRFVLRKGRWAVDGYVQLLTTHRPRTIVEAGIFDGGSAAFLTQVAEPDKLVTFDLTTKESAGLAGFIAAHPLGGRIVPYYGVDQADRSRIAAILDKELGDTPIDLVIDDASHLFGPTRATFNELFPRLRPGGLFIIEDWPWTHKIGGKAWDAVPLTILVFELILARAQAPQMVARVDVNQGWAVVTRGDQEISPGVFDLSLFVNDASRDLVPLVP